MRHELPMKDGWEQDAFTGWRKLYCVFANHHAIPKQMKRRYNKRVRKHAKQMAYEAMED